MACSSDALPPPLPTCTEEPCLEGTSFAGQDLFVEDDADAVWPASAWSTWSHGRDSGGYDAATLGDLFEGFRTSRGVEGIASAFARLLKASSRTQETAPAACRTMWPLDIILRAAGPSPQRRLRTLWERLDARRAAADYCGQPLNGQRAVVVGAGPIGLRCALELRLLGAEVVVLEKRLDFERLNRLHLWDWCGKDLKSWGAKILEPPELSFGADADFLHIGIAELQMLLLKSCLLFGIQVFFGAEFLASEQHTSTIHGLTTSVWDVCVGANAASTGDKSPAVPPRLRGVTALVVAEGPSGGVARSMGLELQETASLRKEAAIGLVANFTNTQCAAEKGRRSFSFARQFYEARFKECQKETGVSLENIVCFIAAQTHYFVMTPTKRSLVELGVLSDTAPDGELLSTLDQDALAKVARAVAAFRWKPEDKPLQEETLDLPVGPPSLFDFSRPKRATAGLRVVEGPAVASGEPARMIVGLCGDGLIAPFWPEGLGIIRGFFGALDLASAIRVWAETGESKAASSHFEAAFRCLKSLAAKTRGQVLKADEQAYGLDPATRYRGLSTAEASGNSHRSRSVPAGLHV